MKVSASSIFVVVHRSGATTRSAISLRGTAVVKKLMLISPCTYSPPRIGIASVVVRCGLVRGSRAA
jgi:hypothetical protein